MNVSAIIILIIWTLAPTVSGVLYGHTAYTMQHRIRDLNTEGSRLIGHDYVSWSIVGAIVSALSLFSVGVSVIMPGTRLAELAGFFVLAAIPIVFLFHSIALARRVHGIFGA